MRACVRALAYVHVRACACVVTYVRPCRSRARPFASVGVPVFVCMGEEGRGRYEGGGGSGGRDDGGAGGGLMEEAEIEAERVAVVVALVTEPTAKAGPMVAVAVHGSAHEVGRAAV